MDEDNQQPTGDEKNIDDLQNDLDTITNNWKRTLADFENYKRRKEAENKELVEFAREVAVAKLLPTLDSLGQALKHMPEASDELRVTSDKFVKDYKNWQMGVSGIVMQLDQALGELGVKKIEALGKKFNPNFHEAIREVESENEDGMVVEEIQTGYELNGKVVRPSQVVISKKLVAAAFIALTALSTIIPFTKHNKSLPEDVPQNNVIVYGSLSSVSGTFIGSDGFRIAAAWTQAEVKSTPRLDNNGNSYYFIEPKKS